MGQKVHPLGFRLGITQKHRSYWYAKPRNSAIWVQDASFLRTFLEKKYNEAGITKIEIHRRDVDSPSLALEIHAARPMLFIDPETQTVDKVRAELAQQLKRFYQKRNLVTPGPIAMNLTIRPVNDPDQSAALIAEKVVKDLEQRRPYRRAMRQAVQKALRAGAKGIRIQVSGRLNGTDIARAEDVREGPVPLQTLRADIDYSSKPAKTIFGLLGVKVWVFYGERLTPLNNMDSMTAVSN
jgi:small subunit ribosomal protein S3